MKMLALVALMFAAGCGADSSGLQVAQTEQALERQFDLDTADFDPIWRGERMVDIRLQASPAYADGDIQKFWETVSGVQTGRWVRASMSNTITSATGLQSGYVANSITVLEWYDPNP